MLLLFDKDIISEMRDASRALDESMMAKVTSVAEDKNQQTQLEMKVIKVRFILTVYFDCLKMNRNDFLLEFNLLVIITSEIIELILRI